MEHAGRPIERTQNRRERTFNCFTAYKQPKEHRMIENTDYGLKSEYKARERATKLMIGRYDTRTKEEEHGTIGPANI